MKYIHFIETPIFTQRIVQLLSDDDYARLQYHLCTHPDAGVIIPRSGGLRKLRWQAKGKGKRGGARIIYYWTSNGEIIIMLYAFPKSERENLTPNELKRLKQLIEEKYR